MRSLDEHLGAAERSNGRVVLLAGDTGMGKTRLLFEFLRRVRASGKIDVLEGRGYEQDQATAFGPLLEALQAARRPGAGRAPRERTEWEGLRKELSRPHPDRQSLQSLQLALRPAAGEKTRLLALEDLHWSDPASLEALHLLARGMDRERLLLLGTYRTDEVGRGHALTHWIAQWTRARQLVEIAVPPLPRDELAMLVDAVLGLAASPGFTSALYERTGGNPLFAEEILRRWIEEQGIEAVRRAAQAGDAPPPGGVPPAVKESVLTRAEKLGAPTRALLRTAAVLGRWFDFDLLKRVSGEGEQEVLQAVGEMVDAGMVQELAGKIPDRFAFRNVLTREAIYDDLLGREKRSLHLKVLAALESEATGGEASERAGALAYHSLSPRPGEGPALQHPGR
jgi:predicted ATPase